jgi:hypothetical protein
VSPAARPRRAGFALLPVVLALSLLAATAYLMTRESAMGGALLTSTQRQDRARYLAEAALRHADWQVQAANCSSYSDIPTTNLGNATYSASVTPTSGSPITVTATGTLADGTSYTLTRAAERVYETPTSLVLQLSSDPGKDAILDSFYANRNFGGASYLQVNSAWDWTQRPLIQFDLPDIPARAEVISARLELKQRSLIAPGRVSVHRVTRGWIEGTLAGGGQADGANWPSFDGTNAWADPGGDFDPAPASEAQVTSATNGQWLGWEVGGLVEGWLADPSSNHGMLLKEDGVVREAEFESAETSAPTDAPRLTVVYACECDKDCAAAPPACDPNYVPNTETGSWSYGDGTSYADLHGLTWVPEGFVLDGVAVPAGGGFVAVDWNESFFTLYDTAGAVLSQTLATPAGSMNGVTWVQGGSYAGRLATLQDMASQNVLHYVDPEGVESSIAIDIDGLSGSPDGITYIGDSASGLYDGHLAIVDGSDDAIYIVDQAAGLQHTIPLPASSEMQGIVHLPGSDSFLTVDWADQLARIVDLAGSVTDSYDLAALDLPRPRAVAIDPLTCDHVVANNRGASGSDLDEVVSLNAAETVLLVVGDATLPLPSKDAGRVALIESWGYVVSVIDDSVPETDLDTAAEAADVVYVSGSIGGGTLAHKLTGSIAPIVNEFPGKLDNFGFSSSTGASVSADTFSKSDAAHHITSPFGGDPIGVFTQSLSMSVPSGTLAPDLQNVAEVSGTAALVALEAGAQRWDGTPAPARRVHLPFGSAETAQLTADGETIMQRAIEWAAGAGGGGGGGGGPTILTLTPSQDTMLRTATTSVYGTDPDMRLNNGATFDYRPLLQFDVSSIAPGTALTSATLRLYTYSVIETGAFTASAYKVTEEWAESWSGNGGAAWYERLKVGGGPSGTLDWLDSGGTFDPAWQSDTTFDPVAGEWVEWDLTPLVQEWVDGVSPNHGVLILPVTLGPYVNFLSKDWTTDPSQRPQLVVEYGEP